MLIVPTFLPISLLLCCLLRYLAPPSVISRYRANSPTLGEGAFIRYHGAVARPLGRAHLLRSHILRSPKGGPRSAPNFRDNSERTHSLGAHRALDSDLEFR